MTTPGESRLDQYAAMIRRWNPAINLVSPATLPDLESRHIRDSLRLAELAPDDGQPWLDIGSGGGLPGLVIAIAQPQRPVTLVDSDRRKVAFLQAVIRDLGLTNCTAVAARIEALPPAGARHVSARALASLDRLMPYVTRHLAAGGSAWLMKGRNWRAELDALGPVPDFRVTVHASATDPDAAVLQLDRAGRD